MVHNAVDILSDIMKDRNDDLLPSQTDAAVPPALVGLLLLLAVVLAIIFLIAAQVVQTP